MDPIRTLLLARTHTVVLDPDRIASASTRPARDGDVDRFEAELVQLGFVMSLDLAMTIRRFPHQTIEELRAWIVATLGKSVGAHRPQVPLHPGAPAAPGATYSPYTRRVLSWLATRPEQPCPWCGRRRPVGALDPCGHLVCRSCWDDGTYAGCPVCHRRVSQNEPFIAAARRADGAEPVQQHDGELRLVHLAFDVVGAARARFERMIARTAPLSKEDRHELETVIDAMGPKAAMWLPARIPVKETMAIAIARLWVVSPDRSAMVRATQGHLRTATDVLRVAAVLMKADPALVEPMRFRSIGRGLRRAVLEALERLPIDQLVEDMRRHRGAWKRIGERLHPFERAAELPAVALAFAALRGTDLTHASFGPAVRERAAPVPNVRVSDRRVQVAPWGGAVEDALRAGDGRAAAERLAQRPGELLRRVDHLVRVTVARQPDALGDVLASIGRAVPRGPAATLLGLASHAARRGAPWPRRVFFPRGDVLSAWVGPDRRAPLPADAIGTIVTRARAELIARAEARPRFARAVIDRGLRDLPVPAGDRTAPRAKLVWPRGSEVALPEGDALRLFLHWEEPPGARVDLDLAVALFDGEWRHIGTCDHTHLVVAAPGGVPAAVHSGDLTAAPPPHGASERVELDAGALRAAGARYAVMVVFSYNAVSFDRLTLGFAGLMARPEGEGGGDAAFDPRAVLQRFDLHGRAGVAVPLTIDLEARRLRWIDVHVRDRRALLDVGGYRAALAHLGRDFADLAEAGARPTLWDVACIHASARANTVYVRGPGGVTTYRRRDGETTAGRLARLQAGEHDGAVAAIPTANAPTWVALMRDDLAIPAGSAGYVLDARRTGAETLDRLDAADLVAELAPVERRSQT